MISIKTFRSSKLRPFSKYTSATVIFKRSLNIDYAGELTDVVKHQIEKKWQNQVKESHFDKQNEQKDKSYVLAMFPYPSGNLHMGHVRVYTISDTIARFHRLIGKNVFQPIGFDAFGLPAENAAMERNISARKWTTENIKVMRKQLNQLGCSFDWDHEVITCSANYYKFTQYLFLLLYKAGLIYNKKAIVNWDPVDLTVLADEQVDNDGRSWRSGAVVEKRLLQQWFVRTTWFAESLRKGLDDSTLEDWKDVIKLQKNWIGVCNGASFEFKILKENKANSSITIWTRYPEFIKDAAFVAVTPESVLALEEAFEEKCDRKLNVEVLNPFTNEKLPVYVTTSVDFDEGSDTKLGLPNVYELDKVMAESQNITYNNYDSSMANSEECYRVCKLANDAGIGGYCTSSKLRDWLISRQRRWGTPIPVVHCKTCGPVPASFDDLPVLIPVDQSDQKLEATCPKCRGTGKWESDTMDTFVDSSWYFLRYLDPCNDIEPFSKNLANKFMPVDVYVGGKEHAVLHLYYARFLSYFLHSIGTLKEPEPFKRLLVQGMVMGKTYRVSGSGKYIPRNGVDFSGGNVKELKSGFPVTESWEKMSKSKHNGVEPSEMLTKYGIDTTRLLVLSDVAPTSHKYWNEDAFPGILNWQRRIWSLMSEFVSAKNDFSSVIDEIKFNSEEKDLWDARNYYTKGITFNYGASHQLSVAISKLQGYTKSLKRISKGTIAHSLEFEKALATFIIMLSPMTPHFASELWSTFQTMSTQLRTSKGCFDLSKSVLEQRWPKLDDNYPLELIFKVNNAVKGAVKLPYKKFQTLSEDEAFHLALSEKSVLNFISHCDILESKYSVVDSYEAILNIVIDHRQKKESAKKVKLSV